MICMVFQRRYTKFHTTQRVHPQLLKPQEIRSQGKRDTIIPGVLTTEPGQYWYMYPDRDVPVFQISIDADAPPEAHYTIGKELSALREQGVLIFGSGNIVHNLRLVDWHKANKGFDWAYEFDEYIYENILKRSHANILRINELGDIARLAVPTPDHFYPLLYTLGASDEDDKITVFNKSCELGSLTMTAYLWE